MEHTGNKKRVQPTLKNPFPEGLGILARIIAREEISRRGWDTSNKSSPLDDIIMLPGFSKKRIED